MKFPEELITLNFSGKTVGSILIGTNSIGYHYADITFTDGSVLQFHEESQVGEMAYSYFLAPTACVVKSPSE